MISIDLTALVICLLVFGLVFVLKNFFFEPLAQAIETRQARIDKAANASEDAERSIAIARAEVDAAVQGIRNEGYQALDEARAEAQTAARTEIEENRASAQARLADAKAKLSQESDRAVQALESDAQALASDIASRILGREVA